MEVYKQSMIVLWPLREQKMSYILHSWIPIAWCGEGGALIYRWETLALT